MIADANNLGRFIGNRYLGITDVTEHNGHTFVAYDMYRDLLQEPLIEYDAIEKFPEIIRQYLKPGSNFLVEVHEGGLRFGEYIGRIPQSRLSLLKSRNIEYAVEETILNSVDLSGDMLKEAVRSD